MSWDEARHPRNRKGEFATAADAVNVTVRNADGSATHHPGGERRSLSWDDIDQRLEQWFSPDQIGARRERHPLSGYNVEVGIGKRLVQPDHNIDGPAEFVLRDHGGLDNKTRPLFPAEVGREPIRHLYRGMSTAEWEQARKRGYIQSDGRGVIASWEGTNAGVEPRTAVSYLPLDGSGVIVKIGVQPEHGWFTRREDGYLRTRDRIPLSDVVAVSPPLHKDAMGRLSEG